MASILDGKMVSTVIKKNLKKTIQNQINKGLRAPGLAVILVGDDEASAVYVKNKQLACQYVGIVSKTHHLSKETSQQELLSLIHQFNIDDSIDGILVQLPLPPHMNTEEIIEAIAPSKDVDCFHPYNMGRLLLKVPTLRPCTPFGIMTLLNHYEISPLGLNAVIIGASNIVGRPMALELLLAGATPTICHSKTKNLETHVKQADLVVIAAGKIDLVDPNWLNSNQIIIDVGIHKLPSGKLRGDINFEAVKDKVRAITPVPGGIGPMTVSTLLQNTVNAWLNR